MATEDKIQKLISDTNESVQAERVCINCKFSYFGLYQESGFCHNVKRVEGNIYPKVVGDFSTCLEWTKKEPKSK